MYKRQVEYRRLGDLADIPVGQIFGGFGNDVIEHFHVLGADGSAMAGCFAGVGVPEAKVGGIDLSLIHILRVIHLDACGNMREKEI